MHLDLLELIIPVEQRHAELISAFWVLNTLNDGCKSNTELARFVNEESINFWWPVTHGLIMTLVIGIYSLVESKKLTSKASLVKIFKRFGPEFNSPDYGVTEKVFEKLNLISNRYKAARHEIYAHNNENRNKSLYKFESLGLTYEIVKEDIEFLGYLIKEIKRHHAEQRVLSVNQSKNEIHITDLLPLFTSTHTNAILNQLKPEKNQAT